MYHDKKIILNSLIAEKILSIEAGDDNEAIRSGMFSNMITGLKEQKMRELLSYHEGMAKVKPDTNELKQIYSVAGRTPRLSISISPTLIWQIIWQKIFGKILLLVKYIKALLSQILFTKEK
jgi:hypothetical protein